MKASRAYIAGLGTSGVLIASFILLLAVVSAIVAFRGYPGEASNDGLDRLDVGQAKRPANVRKAERARAQNGDARQAARGRDRGRDTARGSRDAVRSAGAGRVAGERIVGGGAAGGGGNGSVSGGGGDAGAGGGSALPVDAGGGGGVPLPDAGDVTAGIDQVVQGTTDSLGGGGDVSRAAPVVEGGAGGVVEQTAPVDGVTEQVDGVTGQLGDVTGGG